MEQKHKGLDKLSELILAHIENRAVILPYALHSRIYGICEEGGRWKVRELLLVGYVEITDDRLLLGYNKDRNRIDACNESRCKRTHGDAVQYAADHDLELEEEEGYNA